MGKKESPNILTRDLDTHAVRLPSLGLMALVMGVSVSNPFYAQSLLPSVEKSFGLKDGTVLLGPMATQLGMALGYLLLIPFGDGTERRRMLTLLALGMTLACFGVWMSPTFGFLVTVWFALGLVALIPALLPSFLAAFTPESHRGRMLGMVISGQFGGILLSRSVSGLAAELWGWRSIYAFSGIAMVGVALLLRFRLPPLPPTDQRGYWGLQKSMWKLWRDHSLLRCSCLTQALLFGSFMALWSAVALHLAAPPWRFGPAVIGSFGLVGLASIVAAPMVGRLTDRWGPERIVATGIVFAGLGILLLGLKPDSLASLALGLMMLDLGVQCSFVANQARIYAIDPTSRSRMSSQLFLTGYLGAAICSAMISGLWNSWHWLGACVFGFLLVVLALVIECRQGCLPKMNQEP
jgi:predicted MFS family arabinose efflux permease